MADFNDVINQLKSSNAEEKQRDSRRLNQATAHNQDQAKRFDTLTQAISGVKTSVDKPDVNKGALEEEKRMNLVKVKKIEAYFKR